MSLKGYKNERDLYKKILDILKSSNPNKAGVVHKYVMEQKFRRPFEFVNYWVSTTVWILNIFQFLLIECVLTNTLNLLGRLIKIKGVDANIKQLDSPLLLAVQHNKIEMVKVLYTNSCDVNITGFNGKNSLHWACLKGHNEMAKFLINGGINTDLKNDSQKVPEEESKNSYVKQFVLDVMKDKL